MDDLISRRSAIDAIVAQTIGYTVDEIKAECEEKIFAENGYLGGLKDAIEAIEDMQSAQPETHDKRTETHACDLIDRQTVIDALHGYFDGMLETDTWSPCDVYGLIEILPSAEPDFDITVKIDKAYDDGYETGYLQGRHDWGDLDE